MCSALWHDIDYMDKFDVDFLWPDGSFYFEEKKELKEFIQPHLRSEFVPLYPMPLSSFKLPEDEKSPSLSAKKLSEIWFNEDFDKLLVPVLEKYENWINSNVKEKDELPWVTNPQKQIRRKTTRKKHNMQPRPPRNRRRRPPNRRPAKRINS